MSWLTRLFGDWFNEEPRRMAAYPAPSTAEPEPVMSPVIQKLIALVEAGEFTATHTESGLRKFVFPSDGSLEVVFYPFSDGLRNPAGLAIGGRSYGTRQEWMALSLAIYRNAEGAAKQKQATAIATILAYEIPSPVRATD
jgi:hypothetical protein